MNQDLSESELKQIDQAIDASFGRTAVPGQYLHAAQWALCSVGENVLRLAMQTAACKLAELEFEAEVRSVNTRVDRYKYQLRHALALCAQRLPKDEKRGLRKLDDDEVQCAINLLFNAAAEYEDATRIMWQALSGRRKVRRDQASDRLNVIPDRPSAAYGVIDRLLVRDQSQQDAFSLLMLAFRARAQGLHSNSSFGNALEDIVGRVKLRQHHFSYQVITRLARTIAAEIDLGTTAIPSNWEFPWGTRTELDLFFSGLLARCIYHMLSVHFGEGKYKASAFGQMCLITERRMFVGELVRITDLSNGLVERIVTALTFGEGTKNPDPALQPFIPVGPVELAVPTILIISSDYRRNLLSLQTRVAKKSFDDASHLFEKVMTQEIVEQIGSQVICRANVQVPSSPIPEEVDLLLADPDSCFILVCELRWAITPGDPREVHERLREYARKVSQAARKLEAAQNALPQVCKILQLDVGRKWRLGGIVVVAGSAGMLSPKPNHIPIVAVDVFVRVLAQTRNLDTTHAILSSPMWLPRAGSEFYRESTDRDVCGVKFTIGTFTLGPNSYLNEALPRYVDEAMARSCEELRTSPWEN